MPQYFEKKVSEMKKGDYVSGFFFLKESELKTSTNNNKYMNFTVSDKTGEINAKLWDYDTDNETRFKAGIIVHIKGSVSEFQNQLQLKIDLIRRTTDTDNVSVSDYIPSAPFSGEVMLKFIKEVTEKMTDSELKALVNAFLDRFNDKLIFYPAAKKNHHAVLCGLLYHTATMLKSAIALGKIYNFLNLDLLYTGVILHDMGKMEEMAVNESGLVSEYTPEGNMLGHLVEGVKLVEVTGQSLNISKEKLLLVEHMILSHHYIPEHGSPKAPMFPEAELLHYLDIMDARMYDMKAAFESAEPGKFSERIYSLDNRQVYHYGG